MEAFHALSIGSPSAEKKSGISHFSIPLVKSFLRNDGISRS